MTEEMKVHGDETPVSTIADIVNSNNVDELRRYGAIFGSNIKIIRKNLFINKALLGVVLGRHKTLHYGSVQDLFDSYNISKAAGFSEIRIGKFASNYPRFFTYSGPISLLESKIPELVRFLGGNEEMAAVYKTYTEAKPKKKRKLRVVEE